MVEPVNNQIEFPLEILIPNDAAIEACKKVDPSDVSASSYDNREQCLIARTEQLQVSSFLIAVKRFNLNLDPDNNAQTISANDLKNIDFNSNGTLDYSDIVELNNKLEGSVKVMIFDEKDFTQFLPNLKSALDTYAIGLYETAFPEN